jgi:hypothetical protein
MRPDAPALQVSGRSLSYRGLADYARRVSASCQTHEIGVMWAIPIPIAERRQLENEGRLAPPLRGLRLVLLHEGLPVQERESFLDP